MQQHPPRQRLSSNAVGTCNPAGAFFDLREIAICENRAASGGPLLAAELPEMSRFRQVRATARCWLAGSCEMGGGIKVQRYVASGGITLHWVVA
jgi:hypothetical protein